MDVSQETMLAEINELAGMDVANLVKKGLVNSNQARKWLVKQKYYEMAKTGRTYFDIKNELSVSYGLSVSTIEKMIYKKYESGAVDKRRKYAEI